MPLALFSSRPTQTATGILVSTCFSRSSWQNETMICIYDWELLAIIHALKLWRHYLYGSSFPIQVFTDHKNLTYFHQAQNLNHHQAWWLLDLTDFDLKIIHVPGCLLAGPDALSCHPDLHPNDSDNLSTIYHIHKIVLSSTLDLYSYVHQLQSTFTQVAVRTFWTSVYISLHYVPCTFDPSVLDLLLCFHCSCVWL